MLDALRGVRHVITIEENALAGGFGSGLKEALEDAPFRIHSLGIPDKFIPHGTQEKLRDQIGLTENHIVRVIKDLSMTGEPRFSIGSM